QSSFSLHHIHIPIPSSWLNFYSQCQSSHPPLACLPPLALIFATLVLLGERSRAWRIRRRRGQRREHKSSPPSTQESNLLTKLTSARHSSSFPARFSRSAPALWAHSEAASV
ncbi:hypothetical protein FIBSPDRAFT_879678, partial [Athelia psychrophila]